MKFVLSFLHINCNLTRKLQENSFSSDLFNSNGVHLLSGLLDLSLIVEVIVDIVSHRAHRQQAAQRQAR